MDKGMEQVKAWRSLMEEHLAEAMLELDDPCAFIAFIGSFTDSWCKIHGYDSVVLGEEVERIRKQVREVQKELAKDLGKEGRPAAIWIIPGTEGGEDE